jgi:hypothetical protein
MLGLRLAGGDQAIDRRGCQEFPDLQVGNCPPEFDAYRVIGQPFS